MKYPEYVERVKKMLDNIAWVGPLDGVQYCPCCAMPTSWPHTEGSHAPDCELDLLRQEVPE